MKIIVAYVIHEFYWLEHLCIFSIYGTGCPLDAFLRHFPYILAKPSLEVSSFADKTGMIHLSLYNAENVSHLVEELTEISIDCRISFLSVFQLRRVINKTRSYFVLVETNMGRRSDRLSCITFNVHTQTVRTQWISYCCLLPKKKKKSVERVFR